ncbi:MAG: hypothetical protein ACRDHV_06715 [Actinomycetota bacterium]
MRASSVLTPAQIGMLVVGYVLLAVLSYLYLASGLVVPAPWVWGLWAVLVVLVGLSIRWWRRPVLVLALPFVGALFWVAYLQGLGSLFDWTA